MSAEKEAEPAAANPITAKKRRREKPADGKRLAKFARGDAVATKRLTDKKLKGKLRYSEKLVREATASAAQADEWLLPAEAGGLEAEGMERTWRFKQDAIAQEVEPGVARKAFDLKLPQLGPYNVAFTRSGRHMLMGGRKGHLALMDWQRMHSVCEVQVRETVRDVKFLHNEQFFAVAQKKYVYIYDKRGLEVHCLKEHTGVRRLEFLPYHFLLTSIGDGGILRYQDTSTGQMVAQHRTRLGTCDVMRQNPHSAVLSLGHANGTVSLWSPNITTSLVKMLCHRAPVTGLAFDSTGRHMATVGAEGQLKVWDMRMLRPLHSYLCHRPATTLDISQRGLLAVGFGRRIQVWKDALSSKAEAPYLNHEVHGTLRSLAFCPYEDVLAAGHSEGISTVLAPGAGEPNFDSLVADPFQASRARREMEVHQLLQKLQPDMIVLDPSTVRKEPKEVAQERRQQAASANASAKLQQLDKADQKTKMKGKNRPSRRAARRKGALRNIVDESTVQQRQKAESAARRESDKAQQSLEDVPRALHRFYKKTVI